MQHLSSVNPCAGCAAAELVWIQDLLSWGISVTEYSSLVQRNNSGGGSKKDVEWENIKIKLWKRQRIQELLCREEEDGKCPGGFAGGSAQGKGNAAGSTMGRVGQVCGVSEIKIR